MMSGPCCMTREDGHARFHSRDTPMEHLSIAVASQLSTFGMLIDEFLPRYDVVERHAITVRATPSRTYAAITTTNFADGTIIRLLFFPERAERAATVIGAAGFKGPPDANGEVELGYGIIPSHQRCGFATEAVRGMTKFAFEDARVRAVVGQTILSLAGSIGVLEKAGFDFDGEGNDPHAPDGESVIRYVLSRERHGA